MINLVIGTSFKLEQLDRIIKKNKENKSVKVKGVYGSLRSDVLFGKSARPDFRLAGTSISDFVKFVQKSNENSIEVNYTLNAPLIESVSYLYKKQTEIHSTIYLLQEIGIKRIIISNPLLISVIRDISNIPIEISCIMGSNNYGDIDIYDTWGVDTICLDIYKNRDIDFLKKYNSIAQKKKIDIQLIANEFCMYGDVPCSNIFRQSCYNHSALGGNPKNYFNGWPFKFCEQERLKSKVSWLKAPFILPQYMSFYETELGISNFKITGRTAIDQYMNFLLDIYFNQYYNGNLIDLWMNPANHKNLYGTLPNIMIEDLQREGYFDKWFLPNSKGCKYECKVNCNHCYHFEKYVK